MGACHLRAALIAGILSASLSVNAVAEQTVPPPPVRRTIRIHDPDKDPARLLLWTIEKAKQDAREAVLHNTPTIYWSGGWGCSPNVESGLHDFALTFPAKSHHCGCVIKDLELHVAQSRYERIFNHLIVLEYASARGWNGLIFSDDAISCRISAEGRGLREAFENDRSDPAPYIEKAQKVCQTDLPRSAWIAQIRSEANGSRGFKVDTWPDGLSVTLKHNDSVQYDEKRSEVYIVTADQESGWIPIRQLFLFDSRD